jgi:hypothetical protein
LWEGYLASAISTILRRELVSAKGKKVDQFRYWFFVARRCVLAKEAHPLVKFLIGKLDKYRISAMGKLLAIDLYGESVRSVCGQCPRQRGLIDVVSFW